jgi:hypothetical protein
VKYRIVPFGGPGEPTSWTLYVVPLSHDPAAYHVVFPQDMKKAPLEKLLHGHVDLKDFEGWQQEELGSIREMIRRILKKGVEGFSNRANALFVGGVLTTVLGALNFLLPDPLILLDELFFLVVGSIAALIGYRRRRYRLPVYRDLFGSAESRLDLQLVSPEPLLSRIYQSIKAKRNPESAESSGSLDRIELESQWLAKYLDIGTMVREGEAEEKDIVRVLSLIQDIFPVRRLIRMERRRLGRRVIKRMRRRLREKTGLSDDAIDVYSEFYKSAERYLEDRG